MKVLINKEYIDLSLVKSIGILEKRMSRSVIDNSIGTFLRDDNGNLKKCVISNLNSIEYYEKFIINWITNIPQQVIYIHNPSFYEYLPKDLKHSKDVEELVRNCWNITYAKAVEENNKKVEEEYNKLIEMWSKSKPSDIIKFNFE